MKRTSTLLCVALTMAASSFIGCSNDDDNSKNSRDTGTALQVGADINTRAVDVTWGTNDQIGITMFKHGTFDLAEGNHINKIYVKTQRSNDSFGPLNESQEIYLPQDGSLADFMAYYPYSSAMTMSYVMPINVSDQTSQPKIDFMTAQQNKATGYTKSDPFVKFTFTHRLSKIIINLIAPEHYNPNTLIGSTVTIEGMYTRGNYQLTNNTLGTEPDLASMSNILLRTTTALPATTCEAIVLPRLAGTGVAFQILLANGDKFTAYMKRDLVLASGYKYIFDIKLNQTPAEVSADILPWKDGGESELEGK